MKATSTASPLTARQRKAWVLFQHVLLLALVVLAVHFRWQRLVGNGGQDLFTMINREGFFLIHGRWIHAISQWMPLAALKAGAGVPLMVFLFSVSTPVFIYGAFLTVMYGMRQPQVASGIVLASLLGFSFSFYHDPHLEILYAQVLSLLVYALNRNKELPLILYSIFMALLFLLVGMSYPPTFLFIMVIMIIQWREQEKRRKIVLAALAIVVPAAAYWGLDPYETSVVDFSLKDDGPFRFIPTLVDYLVFFINRFRLVTMVAVLTTIGAVWHRKFLALTVCLVGFLAYAGLIVMFYGNNFRFEYKSLPVLFFIILLMVIVLQDARLKFKLVFLPILCFVLVLNITKLYRKHSDFTNVIVSMERALPFTQCYEEDVIILTGEGIPTTHASLQVSMMLSTRRSNDTGATQKAILYYFDLPGQMASWNVPMDESVHRTLSATSDTSAVRTLVEEYIAKVRLNGVYFRLDQPEPKIVRYGDWCDEPM